MFQLPLATNFRMQLRTTVIAVAVLVGLFVIHGCDQSDRDAHEESPSSLTSQILSLDREQAHEEQREDLEPAVSSAPGTRILSGTIVSRMTGRPEANCRVSFGGTVTHSDNAGRFTLPDVPIGEDARLRFSCRGHIERRSVRLPEDTGIHELDEPIAIGPQQADPRRGPSNHGESVGIADAIRQMNQEREENDGKTSIFGKAGRGLANFAGTAAAIATGTDDDESGRYRVLGQWKRAELSAEEAEQNEELVEGDEQAQAEDEDASDSDGRDQSNSETVDDEGERATE
jgi:hypothetical protein